RGSAGGPGGTEILHARFETFDGQADGAAAGKIEIDMAGGVVGDGEADSEELEHALDRIGIDARDFHLVDAVEMQGGAPALPGLAAFFPGEAVHQESEAAVAFGKPHIADAH